MKNIYKSLYNYMLFEFDSKDRINPLQNVQLNVTLEGCDDPQVAKQCYGYNDKLNICRNKIDNIDGDSWKKVRWYINVYDFQVKDPIINRAFYKYWEIINEFEIFEDYDENQFILHCAEAPGGFIQGTNIYLQIDRLPIAQVKKREPEVDEHGFTTVVKRSRNKPDYKIWTISLNKDLPQYRNYNLPSYNKNIINKYLCISYGKDNTGDINNLENINQIKNAAEKPFYLVTADGGFDEGTDFNHKEQLHYNLILSEIFAAISVQKKNGHFILKVFDILTETSINLIYLLFLCYKKVYIYKPKTSRPTNSEKYIICKYFDLSDDNRNIILNELSQLTNKIAKVKTKFISFSLFEELPNSFCENIKYINTMLLNNQCNHLENAIKLCTNKDFLDNYDAKLQESIETRRQIFHRWEKLYNLNSYV
jgi:23S rRNA U2552 (ribose-2'-O)-methylase RlmE/FtsJ